jgi:hypothetical protein
VAIDISTEAVVTFTEAANELPRRRQGKKTHVSTVHRWATGGIKGIKLESLVVGVERV